MAKRKASPSEDEDKNKRIKVETKSELKPFWNKTTKALSGILWNGEDAETNIDFVTDHSRERLTGNSWFNVIFNDIAIRKDQKLDWSVVETKRQEWLKACEKPKPKAKSDKQKEEEVEKKWVKYRLDLEKQLLFQEKFEQDKASGKEVKSKKPRLPNTPDENAAIYEKKKNKTPTTKCRSALLDLDEDQRHVLKRWMGSARGTYNLCVRHVMKLSHEDRKQVTLQELRNDFVYSTCQALKDFPGLAKTPGEVRDTAAREFWSAFTTNMKRKEKNPEFKFAMKYRKKKDKSEVIGLLAKFYKNCVPYTTFWNYEGLSLKPLVSYKHRLPLKLDHDSKIVRKRDQFFLSVALDKPEPRTGIPKAKSKKDRKKKESEKWLDTQEPKGRIVQGPPTCKVAAVDPGVRTFASIYDPDGKFIEWSSTDNKRFQRLRNHKKDLKNRIEDQTSSIRSKKRNRMRKALHRLTDKIRNIVDESHRKLAKYLCESYNVILLPKFETSKMMYGKDAKLSKVTKQDMKTWSHYRFKRWLLHKAQDYPWVNVFIVTEEYTSKTCGMCGHINDKLGGNKTFVCPVCDYTCDRDFNGSRNILLKWLSTNTLKPHIRSLNKPSL